MNDKVKEEAVDPPKVPAEKTVKVKLLVAHRHNGNAYVAGDELTVNSDAAEFIIANQVGERLK
jgi:hypothetical protein